MRTTYIGMDIHKSFIQAVAVDKDGKILKRQMFKPDLDGIRGFVKEFDGGKVKAAIEACCTWYHVYELLVSLGVEPVLVNARRTKVIAQSKIKTDKLDALAIANCLRTGFIATAYIPPRDVMEKRTVLRQRTTLTRDIARRKNRVHGILLMAGIRQKHTDIFGPGGRKFLKDLKNLSDANRYNLESHLNIIDALGVERVRITKKVEKLCKVDKQAMLLTSIKGVSFYSAMVIITELGDYSRFPDEKKVCGFAGLAPRTMQSGDHCYQGRIIKECNQYIKWILNQCVHTHVRFCPDSPITKLYHRVKAKHGSGKAAVAASRKMLTCMWYMLKRNETFKY